MKFAVTAVLLALTALASHQAAAQDPHSVLAVGHDGRQALVRDGAVIQSCPNGASTDTVAVGAAPWAGDRAVIAYAVVDSDGQATSDIELLSGLCVVEAVARFSGRQFSGVAANSQGELWVSDVWAGELLEIDPHRGSILRSLPLPVTGALKAIDSGGRFYIANSVGLTILNSHGATIRGTRLPAVNGFDLGSKADMWVLSGTTVFHLSGLDLLGWFVLSSAGSALTWDANAERLWVGTLTSEGVPSVLQLSADGARLGELPIPAFEASAPVSLAIVGWDAPTVPEGDGCQVVPVRQGYQGSLWPWICVAVAMAYAIKGSQLLAVAHRDRRR